MFQKGKININTSKEVFMKLIYCPHCKDILRLNKKLRKCECGKCSGNYEFNGINATISEDAIPIGFSNKSFVEALKANPDMGLGKRFDAFIISKDATTIKIKK